MSSKCPSCGQNSVSRDNVDDIIVCTSCGHVVEQGSFAAATSNHTVSSTEYRTYARSLPSRYVDSDQDPTPARGLTMARTQIVNLANTLKLSSVMKQEVMDLFKRIYSDVRFTKILIENKLILAACCLYIVVLNHGWPMSISQLSAITRFSVSKIHKYRKEILETLGLQGVYKDVEEFVQPLCSKADVGKECSDRAKDLICLCKNMWIAEGRKPSTMIQCSMYLSWQSQEWPQRRRVSYKEFCKSKGLDCTMSGAMKRLREILKALVVLAKQLPYLADDEYLSEKNVIQHLPDIIDYQNSLMQRAMLQTNIKLESNDEKIQVVKTDQKRKFDDTQEYSSCNMFDPPSFKVARFKDVLNAPIELDNQCILQYKGDLNSEHLSENDIPDSEMKNYLKTDLEIKLQQTSGLYESVALD